MLRRIREFIYKLGFRPSWPSIFFSPTLAMTTAMQVWTEALERGFEEQREKEKIMRYNSRHGQERHLVEVGAINETVVIETDRRDSFFVRFSFCPICGSKLGLTLQGSKICPQLHGQTSFEMVKDDDEMLPTVTFELYE